MYTVQLLIAVWLCGMFSVVLIVEASCSNGKWGSRNSNAWTNPSDGACGTIDIRNSVEWLKKLENCSAIEGNLHILLIDHADQASYEKFRFPLLREITGHLLLYRVYGLKSLQTMFPNLAVIRGLDLFYNYALVAYEMPDLEELGLVSLTTIMRGAVRLTKNTRLCYVNTIDWARIAVGVKDNEHHIQENKDETKCVNYCPENCTSTTVDGETARRCWTSQHCQKNLDCKCNNSCKEGTNNCCKPGSECIGGCYDVIKESPKKTEQCIACRNVSFNNTCYKKCPPHTFKFMNRRCLTAPQCNNHRTNSGQTKWMTFKPNSDSDWECVADCTAGYEPNQNATECVKCNNSCPKICYGKKVESIDSAQQLKGCNKIQGPLEIHLMGGSNIGVELEESLGEIEEVTQHIKIVRSYALLSLHFFKKLKIIGGLNGESNDRASLSVRDNTNLQELFTEEVTKNLQILNGKVKFHGNRKLCMAKINELVHNLGLQDNLTEHDISPTNNGDLMPCAVAKINVTMQTILRNVAIVEWPKVMTSDARQTLAYIINYREVTSSTVNIYQGRDACSDTIWKTLEIDPENNEKEDGIIPQAKNGTDSKKGTFPPVENNMMATVLPSLKPWTHYAVYVQAAMLTTASSQAISDVIIFRTTPDYPSNPMDLKAVASQLGELLVTWNPPKHPNGNVTHYYVYWQLQNIDSESFDQRDYCVNPISSSRDHRLPREQEQNKNMTATNSTCCQCPKSKKEMEEEERERQIEIEFENYLHDHVYCKREDTLPDGIDEKYNIHTLSAIRRKKRQAGDNASGNPLKSSTPAPSTTTTTSTVSNQTQENMYLHLTIYDTKVYLTNLGHYQEFSIEVLACQEADPSNTKQELPTKLCSNRAITVARTLPLEYADNINASTVEARFIANSTGDVMIKWEAPKNPNGLIIMYLIRYQRASIDHQYEVVCVSQRKFRLNGGHILTKMNAGNYTYEIAAVSLAGNGSYTPEKYFVVPTKHDADPSLNGIIIGLVVGLIVVIVIVSAVAWFCAKSRYTNPDLTVISPNPGYMPSDDLYIPDEWEVPRDKIKLLKELGQGSFGMVYEGKAFDLVEGYAEYKVAIKTVNDNAGFQERMNFLKEATTMKTFKCHHVVKLIGVVSKGQPALVIMELMAHGDLKNYLRMHRPDEEDCVGDPPTTQEILQMAGEIADGMAYLSAKKFVHRDLAARNCMVSEHKVVKIGDFGMTRDIYETDYYRKGNKGLLPVRWMAPESLKDGVFTTMSDVWSYGVVLWEMATLACQPYQGLSNEEVVKYVTDGKIMAKPEGCPPKLWILMQKCWQLRHKLRPTFMTIIEELVPDLDPSFQDVSYFFSEESHGDGEGKSSRSRHVVQLDDDDEGEEREREEEESLAEEGMDVVEFYDEMEEDIDDERFAGLDSHDIEVRQPFIAGEDLNHRRHSPSQQAGGGPFSSPSSSAHHSPSQGNRGASSSSSWARGAGASRGPSGLVAGAGAGSGSGSPSECMMLEELPNGHRFTSPCSSPTSANASGDDSKGSSKSSTGSYSRMNGLANGHIYTPFAQRMENC